jgi:hypothetical protein
MQQDRYVQPRQIYASTVNRRDRRWTGRRGPGRVARRAAAHRARARRAHARRTRARARGAHGVGLLSAAALVAVLTAILTLAPGLS